MKTVAVLAIHRRPEITLATLARLKRQTVPINIVVVGDSDIEREIAKQAEVYYTEHPNEPLAAKYQHGVYFARDLDPDFIMTTGSDSWVVDNWLEGMQDFLLKHNYDGVGKSEFAAFHLEKMEIRERGYMPPRDSEPDGNGRVFTKNAMKKLSWLLYPPFLHKNGIDGASHVYIRSKGLRVHVANHNKRLKVMEIKSDKWASINDWEAFNSSGLKHFGNIHNAKPWLNKWFPKWEQDLRGLI